MGLAVKRLKITPLGVKTEKRGSRTIQFSTVKMSFTYIRHLGQRSFRPVQFSDFTYKLF